MRYGLLLAALMLPATALAQSEGYTMNPLSHAAMAAATGDMGANINAAFAAQHGSAAAPAETALVELPAGGAYLFRTPIVIPHDISAPFIRRPILDCHGSVLRFAGAGDAITVLDENGGNATGAIQNCVIELAPGNRAGVNGVHQLSRIWFSYLNDQWLNWGNATSSGLLLENTHTAWNGYNERTHIVGAGFEGDHWGIRFHLNGGTNSFARTVVEAEFVLVPGGSGIIADNGAYIYGSSFEVHANGINNNDHVVTLINSGLVAPTSYFEGESAACGVSLDKTSLFYVGSDASGPLCNAGTSDHYLLGPRTLGFTYQTRPFGIANQEQVNNPKLIWDTANLKLGIPFNGYPNRESWGSFQVFERTANPAIPAQTEVEFAGDANPAYQPQNVLLADALGVGVGPGFGAKAEPAHTLDVHGDLLWTRAAQLPAGADLNAVTRCGYFEAGAPAHGPAGANKDLRVEVMCSADGKSALQMAVNADDFSSGTWTRNSVGGAWGAWVQVYPTVGFTGTVRNGACMFVITKGLITGVTGCVEGR